MDNDIKFLIKMLIVVIIIFGLTAIMMRSCENRISTEKYGDGICEKCGGHYVYSQAVGHQYDTYYIYICDQCGHLIEVNTYYEGNN